VPRPRPRAEEISPELVLVDPVLRRTSLAEFPDRPLHESRAVGASAHPPRRCASRTRARGGLSLAVCAAAAVIALAVSASSRPPPSHAAAAEVPLLEPEGDQQGSEAQGRPRRQPAAPVPDAGRRESRSTARRRPTKAAASIRAHAASTSRTYGRTFAWPRVPRARSYVVRVFRAGEQIFEQSVPHASIQIPASWKFGGHRYALVPGIYEWSVRPRNASSSHSRYGEAVVRATLTVTAARG
jgi:hypothetical protein